MRWSLTLSLRKALLLSSLVFCPFVSAQAATQQEICSNACAAANACRSQCSDGAGIDLYEACLCQGGCLCNAEICLQCCAVTGNNVNALANCATTYQLAAGNVISLCGIAANTPGRSCFVYGNDGTGHATSTYAANSPFPSSVEAFVAGLPALTGVTIPNSPQTAGTAVISSQSSQAMPNAGTTSSSASTAGISPSSQTAGTVGATSQSSQATSNAGPTTPSSPTPSSSTSTTGQRTTASQTTSAAERTWPMLAKGVTVLLALPLALLL